MIQRIKSAWSTYGPSDGPGHSDHPRIDIKTHRSIARQFKWAGILALPAVLWVNGNEPVSWALAAGLFVIAQVVALGLRVEALEWEVQLDDE